MLFLLLSASAREKKQAADSSIFSKPIQIKEAVHSAKAVRSKQKGDTIVYNAAAYQVIQGADSESLLAKMPGIAVTSSGVEANGKDVTRILIDDQEFFGNDVLTALKNIPADMIRQIEVLNRLSDEAQLTGVDDGNSSTAINIVTKRKKGTGQSAGRVYGSYGISEDDGKPRHNYMAGGNITNFTDKHTLSVIGMSNNISKFNFSTSDIVTGAAGLDQATGKEFRVNPLSGISQVHSLGANYSTKKNNLSYFFNDISNRNNPLSEKLTYTSTPGKMLRTSNESDYNARNSTHKLTGRFTISPGKRHSIIIRPNITFQDLYNHNDLHSRYNYTYTDQPDKFVRSQLNVGDNDRWSVRAGAEATYRYRLSSHKRRSLSLYGRYEYYRYSGLDKSWQYRYHDENPDFNDTDAAFYTYIQDKKRLTEQNTVSTRISYTEPLNRRSQLTGEYSFALSDIKGENLVYRFDNDLGEFEKDPYLKNSAMNRTIFRHNRIGARYNYAYRKISITATARYQHTSFSGDVELPYTSSAERDFHHFLYQVTANIPVNKQNTFRLTAKSKTNNPSNAMMQDVVDMSNTSNIRAGNPDLMPAYMHDIEVRFIHTGRKSGTTFSITGVYTGSPNYFCDSLVINTPDFEVSEGVKLGENNQFVKPINLGGYHKLRVRSTLGFPLDFIRCNFNINATAELKKTPGMINGENVPIDRNWFQMEGRLDSNISSEIDFTLSYNARYSTNEYHGKFGTVENNYLLHRATAKLKWILPLDFTFTGAAQYRQYVSTAGLYNDRMLLCDMFIGKRFLKDRSLEANIGINDLLNQNIRQYFHNVSTSGKTDGTNLALGRYLSVQIIYHIRHASE